MPNEELKIQNLDHTLRMANRLFLRYGIEKVTKEMIAKESNLSIKSIHRYFPDKSDCVLQAAIWLLRNIQLDVSKNYPETVFNGGQRTGSQLLKSYMEDIKDLFLKEPRIFILYSEYKLYVYRNCEENPKGSALLKDWTGTRRLRMKIYSLGLQDGSFAQNFDPEIEEEYFCESFFGFLSNLAISYSVHSQEEIEKQIDQRIENTLLLYTNTNLLEKVRS
jgi:AcrR family transcriptional regulator